MHRQRHWRPSRWALGHACALYTQCPRSHAAGFLACSRRQNTCRKDTNVPGIDVLVEDQARLQEKAGCQPVFLLLFGLHDIPATNCPPSPIPNSEKVQSTVQTHCLGRTCKTEVSAARPKSTSCALCRMAPGTASRTSAAVTGKY